MNYDFNNLLSDERFQDMSRDILQIAFKKYSESFKKVKDDGIDIRLKDGNAFIYGQAKRYSNMSQMKYNLKKDELEKVKKLKPDRYILITSLDYTPKDKKDIMKIFDGYIKDEQDIIGRTDINNLLSQDEYKCIQRKYYELWMDSYEIMEELLDCSVHKSIYRISGEKLKDISENEKTYIESELLKKSEKIINDNNCLLITGEAGIGKTSLAYHIIYKMMQEEGIKFIYAYSPDDILKAYNEDIKQIFLIDDFWGSVFENSYEKREEKKFTDVITMIKNSNNKKLILTTRDYILEEGLKKHPKIYDELLENKIIIKLKEFSDLLKAQILFKHLSKSKLEWNIMDEIASNYKRIINHSMYNPRLIAQYIRKIDNNPKERKSYLKELLKYLDNPESFIKEIFDEQTEAVKIILILLLLMRRRVEENELKKLFYDYADIISNDNIKKSDFANSLKNIDGTLIKIYKNEYVDDKLVIDIEFQNPSIEEFVYKYFEENLYDYANNIIKSTNSLNLLTSLCGSFFLSVRYGRIINDENPGHRIILENMDEIVANKIINCYDELIYLYETGSESNRQFTEGSSELDKIRLIMGISTEINSYKLQEFVQKKIDIVLYCLVNEKGFFSFEDMYEVTRLIEEIKETKYEIKYSELDVIEGYYKNIKFSCQFSIMQDFLDIYPETYKKFLKDNLKEIKDKLLDLILDDIEFYAYEEYYYDLNYFIEEELQDILEDYNMKLPKWVRDEIESITGCSLSTSGQEIIKENNKEFKIEISKSKPKTNKVDILIQEELANLLGKDKKKRVFDTKKIILEKISDKKYAKQIYNAISKTDYISKPIWILDLSFFKKILTFLNKKNKMYENINEFMQDFLDYLIGNAENSYDMKKKLSEFCYEMCIKNQNIWREEEIKNHSLFSEKPEIIDFLIKRKILERNCQWIEFSNDLILWYLCVLHSININENAYDFFHKLEKSTSIYDNQGIIIYIYESISTEKINKEFFKKEIEDYLKQIESQEKKETCSKILNTIKWNLELDSKLKECGGSRISSFEFDIIEYMGYHFDENIPSLLYEIKKNKDDYKIFKEKFYNYYSFEIDFLQAFQDDVIRKLLDKYGIWEEIYHIYDYCKIILENINAYLEH